MLMLTVVCCSDLGQQASDHLDDVRDGHLADLILGAHVGRVSPLPPRQGSRLREGAGLVGRERLDVRQALYFYASRRGRGRVERRA